MTTHQTSADIRRVAQVLDDAVENQDIDLILSCFSEHGEVDVFGYRFKGEKEIRQVVEWMFQRFGRIKFQPITITVEENIFFEEFILYANPEGKEIEIKAAEVLVYEDYKITSLRLYLDRLEVARVLSKGFLGRSLTDWIHRETLKGLPKARSADHEDSPAR